MSQASKNPGALWTLPMIGDLTTLGDLHFNCKEFWWFPLKIHIFTLNLPLSNFHSVVLNSSDGESKNKSNFTSIRKPYKMFSDTYHK